MVYFAPVGQMIAERQKRERDQSSEDPITTVYIKQTLTKL